MSHHLSSEVLSAYFDGELAAGKARAAAAHLAACLVCRSRLEATRKLAASLEALPRAAPPAGLAETVRRQTVLAPYAGWPGELLRRLRLPWIELPLRPGASAALAMGLALAVSVLLLEQNPGFRLGGSSTSSLHAAGRTSPALPPQPAPPDGELLEIRPLLRPELRLEFKVIEGFEAPTVLPETTSQVAGREFVLSDDVWVQRGLDRREAPMRIDVRSRAGRELLARFSDLDMLLADGSRVVLRHNLETLELRRGS